MSRLPATRCIYSLRFLRFPLFIFLIFTGCSLPPKPRLINQPFAQPTKSPEPRAREKRERQKSPPIIDERHIVAQPISGDAPLSPNSARANNSYERLLSALSAFLDAPYELGGATPDGVDCSGLIKTVFAEACGLNLPHNAAAQFRLGDAVAENDLRMADLVFFEETSRRGYYISHIGIYLANRRFIHASTKAGVIVSSLDEAYWRRRFAGARRLFGLPQ